MKLFVTLSILVVFPVLANSSADAPAAIQDYTLDEIVALPEMQEFAEVMVISDDTLKLMLPIMIEHWIAVDGVKAIINDPEYRGLPSKDRKLNNQIRRLDRDASRQMSEHLSKAKVFKWRRIAGITSRRSRSGSLARTGSMGTQSVRSRYNGTQSVGTFVASGYEPPNHNLKYW